MLPDAYAKKMHSHEVRSKKGYEIFGMQTVSVGARSTPKGVCFRGLTLAEALAQAGEVTIPKDIDPRYTRCFDGDALDVTAILGVPIVLERYLAAAVRRGVESARILSLKNS